MAVGVFNPLGRRGFRSAVSVATVGACLVAMSAPPSTSARSQRITEDVRLTLVKKSGLSFVHQGTARGTYTGTVRSKIRMDSLSIEGVVTIKARGGGTVKLRVLGTARSGGLRSKFDGTATIEGGTGRFRTARGKGRFDGVVNRQTWAVTLRATGTLTS